MYKSLLRMIAKFSLQGSKRRCLENRCISDLHHFKSQRKQAIQRCTRRLLEIGFESMRVLKS